MEHNNSSSTSFDPFAADSLSFDDDLLEQWLRAIPATDPQQNEPQDTNVGASAALGNNTQLITSSGIDPIVDFKQHADQVLHNVGATFVEGSSLSKEKGKAKAKTKHTEKEKVKAVEIERKRRQEMSGLYRSLRSMLPAEYIRGKRATADHLQEAVRYIKDMEENIGKLKEKRDALRASITSTGNSTSSVASSDINPSMQFVTVKQCREGFYEIILRTPASHEEDHQKLLLPKALHLLKREGLDVINCLSSKVQSHLIHTIHVQVGEGNGIEPSQLQQQLKECYE